MIKPFTVNPLYGGGPRSAWFLGHEWCSFEEFIVADGWFLIHVGFSKLVEMNIHKMLMSISFFVRCLGVCIFVGKCI